MQVDDQLTAGDIEGLEAMPEVAARFQQAVFGLLHQRDGVAGRAADRLAAVQGRAFAAAIETRDRRLEALVDAREVFRSRGHRLTVLVAPDRETQIDVAGCGSVKRRVVSQRCACSNSKSSGPPAEIHARGGIV